MPGVPTDTDALAGGPTRGDVIADGVDHADDFMARHARVLDAGHVAFLGEGVAVADAAGLDLDPYGTRTGLGDGAFDELEWAARFGNLYGAHACHGHSGVLGLVVASAVRARRFACEPRFPKGTQ